jgi:hypothetical protein
MLHRAHLLHPEQAAVALGGQARERNAGVVQGWLSKFAEDWLASVPVGSDTDAPMWHYLHDEHAQLLLVARHVVKLLQQLHSHLHAPDGAHSEAAKSLLLAVAQNRVPEDWSRKLRLNPTNSSLGAWMQGLTRRTEALHEVMQQLHVANLAGLWLGGLLAPERYLTISRQVSCRVHGVALESLHLCLTVVGHATSGSNVPGLPAHVTGLTLEYGKIVASGAMENMLASVEPADAPHRLGEMDAQDVNVNLSWCHLEDRDFSEMHRLPLYANSHKAEALALVWVRVGGGGSVGEARRCLLRSGACLLLD